MDGAGSETELGASNNGAPDLSQADTSLIDSSLWGADGGLGEREEWGVGEKGVGGLEEEREVEEVLWRNIKKWLPKRGRTCPGN